MRGIRSWVALGAALVTAGAAGIAAAPSAGASKLTVSPVCGVPTAGSVGCFALSVHGIGHLSTQSGPAGYHPADLLAAYQLDASQGGGQTIAIVDAYDDPNAEADLAVYRQTFGLTACTATSGCFRKVNQTGGTTPPASNTGWAEEISLDLDMASAICPNCNLLLVEASSSSFTDLAKAENEAAALGASVISNSYGGGESTNATIAAAYDHPGIPITASSGDGAYAAGPSMPATYSTVTAVGGTSLLPATNARGWTESVWFTKAREGTGSGCSKVVAKPAWQHDKSCAKRTFADVAAVADPATGVSVYDTFHEPGWMVFGGTSASAPIIAGVYALAGNGTTVNDASRAYSHASNLFDVTTGKNGTCAGSYLCTAKVGYDGPTGLGTPNGTLAF